MRDLLSRLDEQSDWYSEGHGELHKEAAAEIRRLRDALGQISGKNDLSGVPDSDLKSALGSALHQCELIAREVLSS